MRGIHRVRSFTNAPKELMRTPRDRALEEITMTMQAGRKPRFTAWPKLEGASHKSLTDRKAEAEELDTYQDYLLENMSNAVREIYELDPKDPKAAEHIAHLEGLVSHEMDDPEDEAHRDRAVATFALAHVQYHLGQTGAVLPEHIKTLAETLRDKGKFLTEDTGGNITLFGKSYRTAERQEALVFGQRAIEGLRRLHGAAIANERRSVDREIDTWRKAAGDVTKVSLDELLGGTAGQCEAGLARETPKGGPVHKGGTLFLESDGRDLWIIAAFRGVAEYVQRTGLIGARVPLKAARAKGFAIREKDPHVRRRAQKVWELVQRAIRTGESDAKRDPDTGSVKTSVPGRTDSSDKPKRRRRRRRKGNRPDSAQAGSTEQNASTDSSDKPKRRRRRRRKGNRPDSAPTQAVEHSEAG